MKKPSILFKYLELIKPRILTLVLVTTTLGYYLAAEGIPSWINLCTLLIGVALVCGGSGALNHYLERDSDKLMKRTKDRPIPSGIIQANNALLFGIILILFGVSLLCWKINLLTSFLSLLTAFLYVLVYTPMKKISWLNTTIGAIPGALPPMGGWVAVTNNIDPGAWILFLILFAWQHPHFYSIAWIFKDDYKQAGFKMLPVVDPDGKSTFRQIQGFSILLVPISLSLFFIGISGYLYLFGSLVLGATFVFSGFRLASSKSIADARKLLKTSVIYLPILLILIVIDAFF